MASKQGFEDGSTNDDLHSGSGKGISIMDLEHSECDRVLVDVLDSGEFILIDLRPNDQIL